MLSKLPKDYPLNSLIKRINVYLKEFEQNVKKYNISGQATILAKANKSFILLNKNKAELIIIFKILKAAEDYLEEELYKIINDEFNNLIKKIDGEDILFSLNIVSYNVKEDFYYILIREKVKNKFEWIKIKDSNDLINKEKKLISKEQLFKASEIYLFKRKTYLESSNILPFQNYIESLNFEK